MLRYQSYSFLFAYNLTLKYLDKTKLICGLTISDDVTKGILLCKYNVATILLKTPWQDLWFN